MLGRFCTIVQEPLYSFFIGEFNDVGKDYFLAATGIKELKDYLLATPEVKEGTAKIPDNPQQIAYFEAVSKIMEQGSFCFAPERQLISYPNNTQKHAELRRQYNRFLN